MKHTNKITHSIVIGGLSFLTGFAMFSFSSIGFSGDSVPDPNEDIFLDNSITPKLHSVDIAGGFNDTDDSGLSIDTYGRMQIKATGIGGSTSSSSLPWVLNHTSNILGIDVSGLKTAVAGRNSTDISGNYGRVGVEGILSAYNSVTGSNNTTMGYVGFLKGSGPNDNYPQQHTIPVSSGTPYAFYAAEGATHLNDTTIEGTITNPSGDISFVDDLYINGSLTIEDDVANTSDKILHVSTLDYQDIDNLNDRYGVMWAYRNSSGGSGALQGTLNASVPNPPAAVPGGDRFSMSVRCPADTYVVGCSGRVAGANQHAPYRGAYHAPNVDPENGECKAWARKPPTSGNVGLYVYAYCYAPHENVPSFDID